MDNAILFDDENKSSLTQEDLGSIYQNISNILLKNNQPYLTYVDWMTLKSLLDVLKFEDEQGIPGFIGIKRKTSLDYLTSIQEKCYDRRYEYQKLIPLLSGKSILDVGCKYGDMSLYTDGSYTGIDISEVAIQEARKIGRGDFIVGDILSLSLNEKFDLAVLSHILEHYEYLDCILLLEKAFEYTDVILVSIPQWFERKKGHKQHRDSREDFEKMFTQHYNIERVEEAEVFSHHYYFRKIS